MEFASLKRRKRQGRSAGPVPSYNKRVPYQNGELIRRRPRSTERAARNDFELDLLDRKYIELRQLIMKSMTSKLPSEKLVETLKLIFQMNKKRELKRNKVSACRAYSSSFNIQGDQLHPYCCNHSSRFKRKVTPISDLDSNGSLKNYFPTVHGAEKSRSHSLKRRNIKMTSNEAIKKDKNLKNRKKSNTTLDSSSSQNSTKYDSKSDVSVESDKKFKKSDSKNEIVRKKSTSKSRSRSNSKSKSRSSSSSSSSSKSTVKKGTENHFSRKDWKSRSDLFDETYCWQNCNKEIEQWLNEKNKALKKKKQEERRLAKEKREKEEMEKMETDARKSASKEKVKMWLEMKKQEEKKQTTQNSNIRTTSTNEPSNKNFSKRTKSTDKTKASKTYKNNKNNSNLKDTIKKDANILKSEDKPILNQHFNNKSSNNNPNADGAINASRSSTKLSKTISNKDKTSNTESSPRKLTNTHNPSSNVSDNAQKSLQRKISFQDQEEALKDLDALVSKELDEKQVDIFGDEIHHEHKVVEVRKHHSIPADQVIHKVTSDSRSGSRPSSRTSKARKMSKAIKMEDFDELKFLNKIAKDDSDGQVDETERKEVLEENLEQFKRLIIHGNLDENDDEMDNNDNNNEFENIFISNAGQESQYVPTGAKNVDHKSIPTSGNKTPTETSKRNEDELIEKNEKDKNKGESKRAESPLLANPWANNLQRPKTSKRRDILE